MQPANKTTLVMKNSEDAKIKRIREIINAGFSVGHVIHRHGLDDATALEVEAALIDAYPGVTNVQGGYGSTTRGAMHALEVIRLYDAPKAEFSHNIILINVNKSADTTQDLYDAVRYAWKISIPRAQKAQFILAVRQGLIIGAYVADQWLAATEGNFPGFPGSKIKGSAFGEEKVLRKSRITTYISACQKYTARRGPGVPSGTFHSCLLRIPELGAYSELQ